MPGPFCRRLSKHTGAARHKAVRTASDPETAETWTFIPQLRVLVKQLARDQTFEGEDRILANFLKADLLIIDDMGLKVLPRQSGEYLFEIIMRRYENKSTVMTSNRPLEDWGKLIGDVPAATAILDRFLHHAEVIAITGRSYRLKDQALKKEACQTDKETVK